MNPVSDWAGRIFGTNTGNVFLQVNASSDGKLTGILYVNDDRLGPSVYVVKGSFDGNELELVGQAQEDSPNAEVGDITVSGKLNQRGEVEGSWSSTINTAGRFFFDATS